MQFGFARKNQLPIALPIVALLLPLLTSAASAESLPDLIARIEPSVVRIEVAVGDGKSQGSGFVTEKGIVTNYHVIDGGVTAKVVYVDGKTIAVEGIRAFDADRDLALLKVARADNPPPIKFAAAMPRKGETVLAFGAPRGFSWTASDGIVSGLRGGAELKSELGEDGLDANAKWVQTTAPISAGNSGGPLTNLAGELVGVNTWTYAKGQNLNFAISASDVQDFLGEVKPDALLSFDKFRESGAGSKRRSSSLKHRLFAAYMEPVFEAKLRDAKAELASAAADLRSAYADVRIPSAEVAKKEIRWKESKEKLDTLKTEGIPVPRFLKGEKSGLGTPGRWFVLQVIAGDALLIAPTDKLSLVICVEGVSTVGVVDRQYREFDGLWFTLGETHTYRNVKGAIRTVHKVRAISADPKEIEDTFRQQVVAPRVAEVLNEIGEVNAPSADEIAQLNSQRQTWQQEETKRRRNEALEKKARTLLNLADRFHNVDRAREKNYLEKIVDQYPNSECAKIARERLGMVATVETRTWTSGQHTTQAKLVGVQGGKVTLEKSPGKRIAVPIERLSAKDREYIEAAVESFPSLKE